MKKADLIQKVTNETTLTKKEAKAVVALFFSEIADALINGDRVEIRGLCSFCVRDYDGHTGRNPKTGETVRVPPKKLPHFKAGKELRARVDYRKN